MHRKQEHIAQGTAKHQKQVNHWSFIQSKQTVEWLPNDNPPKMPLHELFSRFIVMQPFDKSTASSAKAIESLYFPSKESSAHETLTWEHLRIAVSDRQSTTCAMSFCHCCQEKSWMFSSPFIHTHVQKVQSCQKQSKCIAQTIFSIKGQFNASQQKCPKSEAACDTDISTTKMKIKKCLLQIAAIAVQRRMMHCNTTESWSTKSLRLCHGASAERHDFADRWFHGAVSHSVGAIRPGASTLWVIGVWAVCWCMSCVKQALSWTLSHRVFALLAI